ncbi:hypothetical protein [Novosphingobium beihaiensis]|uniref:Uncharacterized protein n=1 Tax=Novosphingobium beihaiensis TaxID=2930389 RepID=A0ABT0BN77_9SPHN|nr:hypothetical protein [Novosphingobium beihaiensis]MCJ2186501.1 hypothetical protein [Novosphingobium beihaiensis]
MSNPSGTLDQMTATDPLLDTPAAERVNYATGILLSADDFRDEQTYHRSRLATALSNLLGHGTLSGLAVRSPEAEDNDLHLTVEPGIALDRYGRLIEVVEPWCIRLAHWFAAQPTGELRAAVQRKPRTPLDVAVAVDVFLSLSDCGRGRTPSFAQGPFDALDALAPARLSEQPSFELVLRAEGPPGKIPEPQNNWPATNASAANKLKAVLGSYGLGREEGTSGQLAPFAEHVTGRDPGAVFLARVAIPVEIAADAPAGVRPKLDLTQRVHADNSIRPFIFMPFKWLGAPPRDVPLSEP